MILLLYQFGDSDGLARGRDEMLEILFDLLTRGEPSEIQQPKEFLTN
jgi:hypothetical protein